jgi:hypothetical protein
MPVNDTNIPPLSLTIGSIHRLSRFRGTAKVDSKVDVVAARLDGSPCHGVILPLKGARRVDEGRDSLLNQHLAKAASSVPRVRDVHYHCLIARQTEFGRELPASIGATSPDQ